MTAQTKYKLLTSAIISAGALFGAAAGTGVAFYIGDAARRESPNDPSAGSAVEIVIATVPIGILVGLVVAVFAAHYLAEKPITSNSL